MIQYLFQIISQKLDECVTSTVDDENHPKYSLNVNLEPLIDAGADDQVTAGFVYLNHIIRDMIDFKTPAAKKLLRQEHSRIKCRMSPFVKFILAFTKQTKFGY